MKADWVRNSLIFAKEPAEFYTGARKIHRQKVVTFRDLRNDIGLADAGFKGMKLSMLTKHYLHEESRNSALDQWRTRLDKGKYGSVGFSCYNHLIKGHGLRSYFNDVVHQKREGKPLRSSIMGPCIQSVCLTAFEGGATSVDVFYRTTELFKKFPADLVLLRDVLLVDFPLPYLEGVTFYFANMTCHPMYFVTLIPHLSDPIAELERIRRADKYFWQWIVKWTARYVCDEYHRGIAKFAQAMRVYKDARARIDKVKMKQLQRYLRDNHPGHRNDYEDADADD